VHERQLQPTGASASSIWTSHLVKQIGKLAGEPGTALRELEYVFGFGG
jgi:hypothetical protein